MAVLVDHNYPHTGDMKVVNSSGNPIQSAEIRIYEAVEYNAGHRDSFAAYTTTDIKGEWVDSVWLPDARTWVVHFQKITEYGPIHIEITT